MTSNASSDDIAAIGLLDEPVRLRLYEWVIDQGRPVGREESANALGIGRALATFHLDRLASSGMLAAGYQRLTEKRGPGAGRPARVYWRAEREFTVSLPDRQYGRAADLFATALERGGGPEAITDAARSMGEGLAADGDDLWDVLKTSGYEPVTEPDGSIRLRNCPFHALVAEHQPLVCSANLALAQGITDTVGGEVGLTPVLDAQPGYCCVAFKSG